MFGSLSCVEATLIAMIVLPNPRQNELVDFEVLFKSVLVVFVLSKIRLILAFKSLDLRVYLNRISDSRV